jgi:hypothetical protein
MRGTPFKKGHAPWNKGKPFVQMLGNTNGFKKGEKPWNKGIKHLQITGDKHYRWKGGIIVSNGYHYLLDRTHPKANSKGYIKYSHVLMEKHLGRPLEPDETVHHINGNKLDDRIENYELFSNNSEHMKSCHSDCGFQKGHPNYHQVRVYSMVTMAYVAPAVAD